MMLFIMQLLHHVRKIRMRCKLKERLRRERIREYLCFSDACITGTYGDIKKIREGIEELDFKP
jgi:putative component of toxin-antitoxin plasmid stabilization module